MAKPLIPAERIYDEALRILDEEGVEGLTVRNLTGRLRCSAKTIYQQVGPREQMLQGVVAHAFATLRFDFAPGPTWQETVSGWSLALRGFLLRHPGLAALMATADRETLGSYAAGLLQTLRDFGWPGEQARMATGLLYHVTLSMTLADLRSPGELDMPEVFATALRWLVTGMEHDRRGA